MNKLKKILLLPIISQLKLFFSHFIMLYSMPIVWFKSLYACRILLDGRLEQYGGCHPHRSFQHFWTRNQWFNINKYGRKGITPLLGNGNFSLSNLPFIGIPGHYIYSNAGAASVLFASLFWSFSHLIWLKSSPTYEVIICTLLLFFSSASFAMTFARQNYSILGWMWSPLALFSILNGEFIFATIFLTLISLFSFTAIFFISLAVLFLLFVNNHIEMIIVLFPAVFLWTLTICNLHNFSISEIIKTFKKIFNWIGGSTSKAKYVRGSKSWTNSLFVYLLLSYTSISIIFYINIDSLPYFIIFGISLLLINTCVMRLADDQSLIILLMMLSFIQIVNVDFNLILTVFFWICLSPPAFTILLKPLKKTKSLYIFPEIHSPYDHTELIYIINKFLKPISRGSRVLWAFENPNNNYDNIFSYFSSLLEPMIWAASQRSILIFPNWYAISENNFVGAPEFWGRKYEDLIKNSKDYDCDHIIYHYEKKKGIDSKLLLEFKVLSKIEWQKYSNQLKNYTPWESGYDSPIFLLLKRKVKSK